MDVFDHVWPSSDDQVGAMTRDHEGEEGGGEEEENEEEEDTKTVCFVCSAEPRALAFFPT